MIAFLLALAVVVSTLTAAAAVASRDLQARLERRTAIRATVVVNLVDGRAIKGVLWSRRGRLLVLRNAQLFDHSQAPPVAVDGEVIIERDRIDFIQAVPA